MGALCSMTSFLGYSEPEEETYEDSYEAADVGYAVQEYEQDFVDKGYEDFSAPAVPDPVAAAPDLRRIVTVHPSTYNEARIIGESFRDGVSIIINLTGISESDTCRVVNFSAGLVFGLYGAIERATPRVFLLTPASVEIDGGEVAKARGRLFNQSWADSYVNLVFTVAGILSSILSLYFPILLVRAVLDQIQVFAHQQRPQGVILVLANLVYAPTDPPLRVIRRRVPTARLGGAGIDLSFLVLVFGVWIIQQFLRLPIRTDVKL